MNTLSLLTIAGLFSALGLPLEASSLNYTLGTLEPRLCSELYFGHRTVLRYRGV